MPMNHLRDNIIAGIVVSYHRRKMDPFRDGSVTDSILKSGSDFGNVRGGKESGRSHFAVSEIGCTHVALRKSLVVHGLEHTCVRHFRTLVFRADREVGNSGWHPWDGLLAGARGSLGLAFRLPALQMFSVRDRQGMGGHLHALASPKVLQLWTGTDVDE